MTTLWIVVSIILLVGLVVVAVGITGARISDEGLAQAILDDDSFGGCTLEFQRAFEQKFIDAGIPSTLSKCYDERCETCHPPVRKEATSIGTVNHKRIHLPAVSNEKVEQSKAAKNRTAVVGGRLVPLPNNVPKFATSMLVYDANMLRDDIVWLWTLDGDPNGKPMAYRQHIDFETFKHFPVVGGSK